MSLSLLFFTMTAGTCTLLLLCMPWFLQVSPEAKRMFSLVTSTREDKRNVSSSERLIDLLVKQSSQLRAQFGRGPNAKLLKRFAQAGLRAPYVADLFLWSQVFGILLGGALGSLIAASPVFWALAGAFIGFRSPDVWLSIMQSRRRKRLQRSVPDMVDLLVICVEAGLGLDQALVRVTEELALSHPDLSAELAQVMLQRSAGATRLDAWRSLAERTQIEEITGFTSMLAETDRFGSPITTALSQFADDLRTKRRQLAEEAAAKTKVKIIFPLVLCIFPCIFIVLLVPAILSFFHSFSTMGR